MILLFQKYYMFKFNKGSIQKVRHSGSINWVYLEAGEKENLYKKLKDVSRKEEEDLPLVLY